jgi:tRNA A-37 threonylcarbamoyl transferase component Bud32
MEDHKFNWSSKISQGHTSEVSISSDKQFVKKRVIKYLDHNSYEREIHVLKLLNHHNFDWCPKFIQSNDNELSFVMTYCGERMNKTNKPRNYKEQMQKILKDMKSINLKHNDIKSTEVLVYKSKIFLIDFGWASINDDFSCGVKGISSRKKPCEIFDDNRTLTF